MERKISFGKVDYRNKGRKDCEVVVRLELKENNQGDLCFSSSASLYNPKHTDCYEGGQCNESIQHFVERDTPYAAEYAELVRLWKNYHLNDLHAGTPEQEKALRDAGIEGFASEYDRCCDYLKSIGLYEVTLPDGTPYKFGHGWLTEPIPEKDLEEIKDIIERGMEAIKDYLPEKELEEMER